MPKKSKSAPKSKQDWDCQSFHVVGASTTASGVATIPLTPAISTTVGSLGDTWAAYRFTRLRFRLHPAAAQAGGWLTACYVTGITDTAPASVSAGSDNNESTLIGKASTVPSRWVNVPKLVLSGYHPWYKTVGGSPESAEEVQGNIFINDSAAGTAAYIIEIEGTVEFKDLLINTSTPMLVEARQKLHAEKRLQFLEQEKKRMLDILSSSERANTPTTARLASNPAGSPVNIPVVQVKS